MDLENVDRGKDLLEKCLDSLQTCAGLIVKYSSDDKKQEQLKEVKHLAKKYYDIDMKTKKINEALDLTTRHFNEEDADLEEDVNTVFKQKCQDAVCVTVNFNEHTIMKKLMKMIADSQMSNEDLNKSVICSQSFHIPVDPITKSLIQTPWKNKVCGHIYELKTILAYIKSRKGKLVKCPYIGCSNVNVQETDLKVDEELFEKIKATSDHNEATTSFT